MMLSHRRWRARRPRPRRRDRWSSRAWPPSMCSIVREIATTAYRRFVTYW